ncbi:hypothetical protein NHX12_013667 [Muraenolepis orangiensis]|uniref:Uncharacterized protein n=1 Tax=Muraenolepis orangiensis TaxID=630683 RepID=A0A9Q0D9W5_9TELE|nr:hypothetical protein NHX12_013667 [Muraenolepis orangiensis]
MVTHLQAERERMEGDEREEERLPSSSQHPCVSVVMRVEHKEGVSWRNTGSRGEQAGLSLYFLVRAELIGPALRWGQDPRNSPVTDMESHGNRVTKPNCFYRIVVPNSQDPSVLIGSEAGGQSRVELHTNRSLQVGCDWMFHTLDPPTSLYSQWEGLQRAVRVRGHIRFYFRGRGLKCYEDSDWLLQYLDTLCSSSTVCRPVEVTCKTRSSTPCTEGKVNPESSVEEKHTS